MPAIRILLLCVLLTAGGCARHSRGLRPWEQGKAVAIADLRGPLPGTKTVPMQISRERYLKALEQGNVNTVRMVEVYSRYKTLENPPEYRLFDVREGSVYNLLGLETSDVILAADGYIIPSPAIFWQYLNLLKNQERASIELVRGGRPLILEYTFVP